MIDGWRSNIATGEVIRAKRDKFTFKNNKGVDVNTYTVEYPDLNIYLSVRHCKECDLISASFGLSTIGDLIRLSEKYKVLGFHIPSYYELELFRENLSYETWREHWVYNHNYISGQIYRELVLVSDYKLEEI